MTAVTYGSGNTPEFKELLSNVVSGGANISWDAFTVQRVGHHVQEIGAVLFLLRPTRYVLHQFRSGEANH